MLPWPDRPPAGSPSIALFVSLVALESRSDSLRWLPQPWKFADAPC